MNIRVKRYTRTPSGRTLKNKYIVYDADTMKPLSGMSGTSRTTAYKIAKRLREKYKPKTRQTIMKYQKKIKANKMTAKDYIAYHKAVDRYFENTSMRRK